MNEESKSGLRHWLLKLTGVDRKVNAMEDELSRLRATVRRMGWDNAFQMLTRPALEESLAALPRKSTRIVVFIDMDKLHAANLQWGYDFVNRKIARVFGKRRKSDLIGRWYNGDEIVIVLDLDDLKGATRYIEKIRHAAFEEELSFTYALDVWRSDEKPVLDLVKELSKKVLSIKAKRAKESPSSRNRITGIVLN